MPAPASTQPRVPPPLFALTATVVTMLAASFLTVQLRDVRSTFHALGHVDGAPPAPFAARAAVTVTTPSADVGAVTQVTSREGPATTLGPEFGAAPPLTMETLVHRLALGAIALALGVGALSAWLVTRYLGARLRKLAAATRAVAAGDLTTEPIQDSSRDEVGELVASFNVMLTSVKGLIEETRDAGERERLDALVEERTLELNTAVHRYRTLLEDTNAAPWELDPVSRTWLYLSPRAEQLYGRTRDSAVDWSFVVAEDVPIVQRALESLSSRPEAAHAEFELRVLRDDGRCTYVRNVVSKEADTPTRRSSIRGISFDITQQKMLELDLRQAQKLESVGRLAAGVAHEINTPVQFVSDSVHFVRDAMPDLARLYGLYSALRDAALGEPALAGAARDITEVEEQIDLPYLLENVPSALERSLDGLDRVASIVRAMKEFAHPEQKQMRPVDLNRAIESTLTIARNEYKYVANVETDFGDLPPVVCHGGDVNQAILNIVVNAAHAIGDKVHGTDLKGEISVRTRQEDDTVLVTIRDTGGGIPSEIRHRIFDPFFTTKEVGKGTGQGLAIARSIVVDKHGGELTVDTRPGEGTTFAIRLPIAGRDAPPLAVAS